MLEKIIKCMVLYQRSLRASSDLFSTSIQFEARAGFGFVFSESGQFFKSDLTSIELPKNRKYIVFKLVEVKEVVLELYFMLA